MWEHILARFIVGAVQQSQRDRQINQYRDMVIRTFGDPEEIVAYSRWLQRHEEDWVATYDRMRLWYDEPDYWQQQGILFGALQRWWDLAEEARSTTAPAYFADFHQYRMRALAYDVKSAETKYEYACLLVEERIQAAHLLDRGTEFAKMAIELSNAAITLYGEKIQHYRQVAGRTQTV